MKNLKHGTLIAIAAGSLFAAACKKSETKQESAPAASDPAKTTPAAPADKPATPAAPAADSGEKTAKVHCMGINDCTGKGACKTPKNDCMGKNACKGQGFIDLTEEECKTKGGTVATNVGM